MLWTCCCRLRQRKLHEQRKSRKEEAIILADCSRSLGPVSPALQLRQAVQGAFYTWPVARFCIRRGQFALSISRRQSDKRHLPRSNSEPDGIAVESRSLEHGPKNQFDRFDLPGHPSDHDGAQSLFLRQFLLHELGEQQSGNRHSEPALWQDCAPLHGVL